MSVTPTPKGRGGTIAIVVVVVVLVAAVAGYFLLSGKGSGSSTTSNFTSPKKIAIDIASGTGSNNALNFSPSAIKVVLGVNNTISWANNDNAVHTVTFTSAPSGVSLASLTDPNNLQAGQSYTLTLTTAGTYQYQCTFHNWMHGTITVVQAA